MQVGLLLAYLSGKVLGQYELFLPPTRAERRDGRLTLVAPNIVAAERQLDADPRDFRLWVCVHEVTHRTQFTAVPWLREHVQDEISAFSGRERPRFSRDARSAARGRRRGARQRDGIPTQSRWHIGRR